MKTKITLILTIAILILFDGTTANAQRKQRQTPLNTSAVKIYLVDTNRLDVPGNPGSLFPVTRRVDSRKPPIAAALEVLTKGATIAEKRRGWHDSTFGIQFVSVELNKDGSALARFTMPKTATFGGTNSPLVFIEAVEKTALQFASVKRVTVCLDGAIDFWREDEIEPKKC